MKRFFVSLLVLAVLFTLGAVAVASSREDTDYPSRLRPDTTEQQFEDHATPTAYTTERVPRRLRADRTRQRFRRHRHATLYNETVMRGGSACTSGSQGYIINLNFTTWSQFVAHELAQVNMEVLWCTRNGNIVPGRYHPLPINHCGDARQYVYDYDGCSMDRGSFYLSSLHIWYDYRYSWSSPLHNFRLTPQLDYHVRANGVIAGVYRPT